MAKIQYPCSTEAPGLAETLKRLACDGTQIDAIQQITKQFAGREGRRPRILFSNIGGNRLAKTLAVSFGRWGFDVDIGPEKQTPEQAAGMAVENDVHIICYTGRTATTAALRMVDALNNIRGGGILVTVLGSVSTDDSICFCRSGRTGGLLVDKTITQTVLRLLEQIMCRNGDQ